MCVIFQVSCEMSRMKMKRMSVLNLSLSYLSFYLLPFMSLRIASTTSSPTTYTLVLFDLGQVIGVVSELIELEWTRTG